MTDTNYDFPVELQPIYLGGEVEIKNKKAVVRTDTNQALGIASDNYGLVKHATVIDQFREAGAEYGVEEKISLTKNGANLFYQMTFPKVEAEVQKGDIVRMMMIAKNSYNSGSSLQVIFGAFRLVCENGMILGTKFLSFNFRHIGNVGGVNDIEIMNQYKDSYTNYIKLFGEKMPIITAMAQKEIPNEGLLFDKDAVHIPEYLLKEAESSFNTHNDKSLWGYYNSLTDAVTHKMRKESPALAINYGITAWKAAESYM